MTGQTCNDERRSALRQALMEAGYFGLASALLRPVRRRCMKEKEAPPPPSMDAAA